LAELEVAESDALHGGEDAQYPGEVGEEFCGFGDGHFEYIGDGFSSVFDEQGFAVVAFSLAVFALDVDVGKKVHFDFPGSGSLAHFASSSFDVEAESSGFVSSDLRFGHAGEEVADEGEGSGVGCGVGARGAAYG